MKIQDLRDKVAAGLSKQDLINLLISDPDLPAMMKFAALPMLSGLTDEQISGLKADILPILDKMIGGDLDGVRDGLIKIGLPAPLADRVIMAGIPQ